MAQRRGSANVSSVCCRCKFAGECCPWCKIFWTPTSWSETCLAVLHSLFTFTLSMRPRGSSWFLLRRPMRANVPDQIVLAKEKLSRRRRQRDGVAISFKLPRKIAGSNDGETRALVFVDESLWLARLAGSENARCFDAALAFGRNGPTNGRSAHYRFSRSLRCLDEKRITTASIAKLSHRLKKHVESRNNVQSLMRVFTGVSTLTMLADSLTKPAYPARGVMESFMVKQRWRCTFDFATSESKRSTFAQ